MGEAGWGSWAPGQGPGRAPRSTVNRHGASTAGTGVPPPAEPGEAFGTVPHPATWHAALPGAAWLQALDDVARRADDPLAIGVHVPFCAQRCAYCAHDVAATGDGSPLDAYLDALEQEFALVAGILGARREVGRLHVGGGTPNLLDEAQFERLRGMLERHFRCPGDTEASIDCDPRRSSRSQFEQLRALGFRHVRFGMADLDPAVQRASGRLQSARLVADAVANAQDCGFETVQVDLVCGLPGQDPERLAASIEALLAIGPDRIRCLRYLHDPLVHPAQRSLAHDAAHDAAAVPALYAFAAHALQAAGYHAIGDGWYVLDTDEWLRAREAGSLLRSALGYTATPAADLLCFGPGRSSDAGGTLARNETSRAAWAQRLRDGRLPTVAAHRRTPFEARQRAALDHLFAYHEFPARLAAGGLEAAWAAIARHAGDGWVRRAPDRLLLTEDGRCHLDQLAAPIATALPPAMLPLDARDRGAPCPVR